MRNLRPLRTGIFFGVLSVLAVLNFPAPVSYSSKSSPAVAPVNKNVGSVPQSSNNFTYYAVRRDVRRCVSPLCGGFFVKRVNNLRTRCANGRNMNECYVAEIDWRGTPAIESQQMLVRGDLSQRSYPRFGQMGVLRVTEAWRAATGRPPQGMFYRVKDLNVRCITHPCMTHQAEKLNTYVTRRIAGVELGGANATEQSVTEAQQTMTGADGILVTGNLAPVRGPAGRAETLKASQFYLRGSGPVATKPCRKTGCSSQVCSDQEIFTTCEWRQEYECYRRARCERQANGECGFTQTRELTACLRRR